MSLNRSCKKRKVKQRFSTITIPKGYRYNTTISRGNKVKVGFWIDD